MIAGGFEGLGFSLLPDQVEMPGESTTIRSLVMALFPAYLQRLTRVSRHSMIVKYQMPIVYQRVTRLGE